MEIVKEFVNLLDKRYSLIESKCTKLCLAELLNTSDGKIWHEQTIEPLNKKIVELANEIIKEQNLKCNQQKTIGNVYNNSYLKSVYINYKTQNNIPVYGR